MISRVRAHIRTNVVGYLALFVALGGTGAYAASELIGSADIARNAVLSRHIRLGNVKRQDLANNAVNSARVANGSLLAADFAAGQIPTGPTGPAGATNTVRREGDPGTALTGVATSQADCLQGEHATGGGFRNGFDDVVVTNDLVSFGGIDSWIVQAKDALDPVNNPAQITAFVICVSP
jgi:hypothetical protein